MTKLGWAWKLSNGRWFRWTAANGYFYVWASKPTFDQASFALEHPGRWYRVSIGGALAKARLA